MPRFTRAQIVLLAAAVVLGLGLATSYWALRKSTANLIGRLDEFGTSGRNPGAVHDVARETNRSTAGLMAARALLAEELDRRWLRELDPEELGRAVGQGEAKLELARDLALEALREQPSSWQALMILGGARYLLASRRNVPGRWSDRDSWALPLSTAIARAPAQPEPKRVLAAAYLSEWSIASDAERQALLPFLQEAFRDLNTLEQLLPAWLNRAGSFEQALSVISPDPRAWRQLDHYYRQREDWQRLAEVLDRLDRSLPEYLHSRLELAHKMLDGGEAESARRVVLTTIDEIPMRAEYADHLAKAINQLPPGPISARRAERLGEWIEWSAERCLLADCPFSVEVFERLTRLARSDEPGRQALGALLRGDLAAGVSIEQRNSARVKTPAWMTYDLLKAKVLANLGQTREAGRLFQEAGTHPGGGVLARHLAQQLGSEQNGGIGTVDSGWRGWKRGYRRELLAETAGSFEIRFPEVAGGGAVVEVRVNQSLEGFHPIEAGTAVRIDLGPGYVRVDLLREAGSTFRPAEAM